MNKKRHFRNPNGALKKKSAPLRGMCGCYVDADHNKITKIGETFLNLEDEEFYKYLEIAKSVVWYNRKQPSGAGISTCRKLPAAWQQFLMGLRESRLKMMIWWILYDMIIDSYDYVGNYLILIFHDAYDCQRTKTSDNDKLRDESEEVYEYLLKGSARSTWPNWTWLPWGTKTASPSYPWLGCRRTGHRFVFPCAHSISAQSIHSVMFLR